MKPEAEHLMRLQVMQSLRFCLQYPILKRIRNGSDESKNPASQPSALGSAIEAIERGLCADGAGNDRIPDGERAGFEWRALFRWAESQGLSIPAHLKPERVGGREHV